MPELMWSLDLSSVCVVDDKGKIVCESKGIHHPDALAKHFADIDLPFNRIGLEAGPLSQWLREGLIQAGFDVVLLKTRHVKAALARPRSKLKSGVALDRREPSPVLSKGEP